MNISFSLGHVSITPDALQVLRAHGVTPESLLDRHSRGDWGEIDLEDEGLNEHALGTGACLWRVYTIAPGVTVWVITEAADEDGERPATAILLPSDY
jgi:hypothetical protein